MRGSPLPIFTALRTQGRECTGKRAGPRRRISPVIPTNRIESVSTPTPKSVRVSTLTVRTSKQSRAIRSWTRTVSRRWPANRHLKTIKEQLAPFVYRYRNTDQFAKVASQESKTPAELVFPTTETGRYVVAVNATKVKAPVVSDETSVTGEAAAQLPVVNETTFKIE